MATKYTVFYISILSLVLVLALSSTFLSLERAWADSVIATATVGTGPYGAIFNPSDFLDAPLPCR